MRPSRTLPALVAVGLAVTALTGTAQATQPQLKKFTATAVTPAVEVGQPAVFTASGLPAGKATLQWFNAEQRKWFMAAPVVRKGAKGTSRYVNTTPGANKYRIVVTSKGRTVGRSSIVTVPTLAWYTLVRDVRTYQFGNTVFRGQSLGGGNVPVSVSIPAAFRCDTVRMGMNLYGNPERAPAGWAMTSTAASAGAPPFTLTINASQPSGVAEGPVSGDATVGFTSSPNRWLVQVDTAFGVQARCYGQAQLGWER